MFSSIPQVLRGTCIPQREELGVGPNERLVSDSEKSQELHNSVQEAHNSTK